MESTAKPKYRIRNWSEYNKSLVQRGRITLWFSEEAIEKWHFANLTGKKGRALIYSDDPILSALLIRTVYNLPLRGLEGFFQSIVTLLRLPIRVPCYTQICRRAFGLGKLLKKLSCRHPCDIVFDSTGLKVYGEGERKARQHGVSKRRTWRNLHVGMDPESGEIIMAELTDNGEGSGDGEVAKKYIKGLRKGVKRVFADGAYDGIEFRREVEKIGVELIVPPPKGSIVHENPDGAMKRRNDAVLEILGLGGDDDGRKLWKKLKGYHRRSLVETTMYRIKQITGSNLRSRELESQSIEASIKYLVINKMTSIGMPVGVWQ